jgi:hypothetical protein
MVRLIYPACTEGPKPLSTCSLPACRTTWRQGADPSKTQALLCFQMIQAPSITSELNPFLCSFGSFLQAFNHQSSKEIVPQLGTNSTRFKDCRTAYQNCVANTRCEDVLYCFFFLVTEGTVVRVTESSFLQPVNCPTAISDG